MHDYKSISFFFQLKLMKLIQTKFPCYSETNILDIFNTMVIHEFFFDKDMIHLLIRILKVFSTMNKCTLFVNWPNIKYSLKTYKVIKVTIERKRILLRVHQLKCDAFFHRSYIFFLNLYNIYASFLCVICV